jgi:uncharacterized LabA/DUF88 family protein
METKRPRLAVFLDYEDVALALKGEDQNFPRPADIIRPIIEEFCTDYDIVIRYAYADWSRFPKDSVHLIDALGFTCVYSLARARYASDTVEMAIRDAVPVRIAVDAMTVAMENPTLSRVVFVAGDREYYEVIDKLRELDHNVSLLAFERSVATETTEISGVETIFLENLVGQAKSSGPEPERKIDWTAFIRLLLSLELRYGYVGYRGLKEKLDMSVGCGPGEQDKRKYMDMAVQQEIITLDKMTNPKNPEFPLTVCRLNRKHPMVQAILKTSFRLD